MFTSQKQPPEVFCKKKCSQKFCKIHRKTPVPKTTFFKKSLQHWCFPVNLAKFPSTTFLQKTSGQLLLTSFMTPKAKVSSFYDLIRLVCCCFASFMVLKAKNEKFLWLDKTFVSFYFTSFLTLKTKTGSFYTLIRHLFLVLLICSWLKKLKPQVAMA